MLAGTCCPRESLASPLLISRLANCAMVQALDFPCRRFHAADLMMLLGGKRNLESSEYIQQAVSLQQRKLVREGFLEGD